MPVDEAAVKHKVDAGITYGQMLPGIVPPYLEYQALVAAGYNEATWRQLTWQARARAVAWYRLSRFEALHVSDAQAEAARRAADKS